MKTRLQERGLPLRAAGRGARKHSGLSAKSKRIMPAKIVAGIVAGFFVCTVFAQDVPGLANANNSFGFDLFGQIVAGQPQNNVFISPFSAAAALQMVAVGAQGQTRTEMESVLETDGWSPLDLNRSFRDLNHSLTAQRDATLEIANSVWYRNGLKLHHDYISHNEEYFNAGLAGVDFSDPKTADTINDWADGHTHGKIRKVVSFPFPADTALVLADAVYFKGKWKEPFEKGLTAPRDFHLPDGSSRQTPMMQRDGKFSYQQTADFQAVQLPYNGELRMELFLPGTNFSPQKLVEEFRHTGQWQKTEKGFGEHDGFLVLPKFRISSDVTLNAPLENLGMKLAFMHGNGSFLGIADDPELAIEEVKQNAYVSVDEEETEAAAVTTVMLTDSIEMPPKDHFTMILNRPFFFVIADDKTQTLLFMGLINNPVD